MLESDRCVVLTIANVDLKLQKKRRAEEEAAAAAAAAEAEANEPRGHCKCCGNEVKQKDLFPCPKCYLVKYCSDECMKMDKRKHKFLCETVAPPEASEPSEEEASSKQSRKHRKESKKSSKSKKIKSREYEDDDSGDDEDDDFLDFDSDESSDESAGVESREGSVDDEGDLDDENRMAACNYCKEVMSMTSLSACANCQCVLYCSLECQTRHWPKHGLECATLAAKGGGPVFEMDLENDDEDSYEHDDDELHETESLCDNCGVEDPEDLWLMCGKCHKVVYCCFQCQTEAWPDHEADCERLAKGKKPKKSKKDKKKSSDIKSKSKNSKSKDSLSKSTHSTRSKTSKKSKSSSKQ